jgi:hypothetical protein
MMKVLIISVPADYHALAVKWALEKKGVTADLLYLTDIPQLGSMQILHGLTTDVTIEVKGVFYKLQDYSSVWFRRVRNMNPSRSLHPSDLAAAQSDWREMVEFLYAYFRAPPFFCVNPPESAPVAGCKPYQLWLARHCGLLTPPTLVTNDKDAIPDFIRENRRTGHRTIAKGFRTTCWATTDGKGATFSTIIVEEEDIKRADTQSALCIFQPLLEKKFEARVCVNGRTITGAKLNSQEFAESQLDFRLITNWKDLACEELQVPDSIQSSLIQYQKCSGAHFATMDFIIDHNDEWTFLENNQAGNILWIEDTNPEIKLLDTFSEFLISRDPGFIYNPDRSREVTLRQLDTEQPKLKRELVEDYNGHAPVPVTWHIE